MYREQSAFSKISVAENVWLFFLWEDKATHGEMIWLDKFTLYLKLLCLKARNRRIYSLKGTIDKLKNEDSRKES
jgi:hypothetical protein